MTYIQNLWFSLLPKYTWNKCTTLIGTILLIQIKSQEMVSKALPTVQATDIATRVTHDGASQFVLPDLLW